MATTTSRQYDISFMSRGEGMVMVVSTWLVLV
jgi:hypothetical protein